MGKQYEDFINAFNLTVKNHVKHNKISNDFSKAVKFEIAKAKYNNRNANFYKSFTNSPNMEVKKFALTFRNNYETLLNRDMKDLFMMRSLVDNNYVR